MMRSPDRSAKIEFQYEVQYVPPVWPPVEGEPQMMIHIDIGVEDLDAGVVWAAGGGRAHRTRATAKAGRARDHARPRRACLLHVPRCAAPGSERLLAERERSVKKILLLLVLVVLGALVAKKVREA